MANSSIRYLSLFCSLYLNIITTTKPVSAFQNPLNINATPAPEIMRAWRCHGKNNQELVENLGKAAIIQSKYVEEAMLKVDRGDYVLDRRGAYDDCPQGIGYAATISAPHMHAHALEDMLPALARAANSNEVDEISILDVGSGSGYLSACLGRMVDRNPDHTAILGKTGRVYGIDYIPELVDMSKRNMQQSDSDLVTSGTVSLNVGDGWKGLPEGAPYHAIHVGAAADGMPQNLMTQLAIGGTLICPIGPDGGSQNLYTINRVAQSPAFTKSDYEIKPTLGVRYVPLVKVGKE